MIFQKKENFLKYYKINRKIEKILIIIFFINDIRISNINKDKLYKSLNIILLISKILKNKKIIIESKLYEN